jgi:hypothetical protein
MVFRWLVHASIWVITLKVALFSQTIDITGKILNKENSPQIGVITTLKHFNISDTTGPDGIYHLTNMIDAVKPEQNRFQYYHTHLKGKTLFFSVQKQQQSVSIDIYSLSGEMVCTILNENLPMGNYSISPLNYYRKNLPAQVYIIRLKIDNAISYHKMSKTVLLKNETLSFRPLSSNILAKQSQQNDTITFTKEGQVITTIEVSRYVDTLTDLFIIQRDIFGNLSGKPDSFGKIGAIIRGGSIPDGKSKFVELWYNEPNQSYSGFVYFIYSAQTMNYSVFVSVYNRDNVETGRSVLVNFPSTAGNINIPQFNSGNAIPHVNAGKDTTVSINDTIKLHALAIDSFGGTVNKWEWSINGGSFIQTSMSDTSIIAPPDSISNYNCIVRVSDNEGNSATDSIYVIICKDAPVVSAGGDITVSIHDSIRLHGSVQQKFGDISKWEWSLNGSAFVRSATSDTVIIAPADSMTGYKCLLRITDDDGNTSIDSLCVTICEDVPVANAGNDITAFLNSQLTLHGQAVQRFGSISKWEWNIGNTGFVATSSSDTTFVTPSRATSNFQCILRVTDDDGNVDIDTVVISLGLWQSLVQNGFDICTSSKPRVCLAVDIDTPYVAFIAPDTSVRVMKYTNNSWISVGDSNVLKASKFSDLDLKIVDGIPYVAASGYGTGNQFTVMQFNNGSWTKYDSLGTGTVNKMIISLAISGGVPYLAYRNQQQPGGGCTINAIRYNNNSWESLGSEVCIADNLFSPLYLLLKNNVPFIAYDEYLSSRKIAVKKFENQAWVYETDILLPNGYYSLAMHSVKDSLVMAFSNYATRTLSVKKYTGTSWQYVGDSSFTLVYTPPSQDARYPILYLTDVANSPVVAFISTNQTIDFRRYNGNSWENYLKPISASNARYAFAVSKNDVSFIAYCNSMGSKISVLRFK